MIINDDYYNLSDLTNSHDFKYQCLISNVNLIYEYMTHGHANLKLQLRNESLQITSIPRPPIKDMS